MCKRRLMLYFFSQILHMLSAEGPVDNLHAQHSSACQSDGKEFISVSLPLVLAGERPRRGGPEREQLGREPGPKEEGGGEREHREFTTKRREKAEPTTVPTPSSADRYRRD